jgi:transposase InsO family protein
LGISRSVVRFAPQPRQDEPPLRQAIIRLAGQYGRYGYRQITGLLWLADGSCVRLRPLQRNHVWSWDFVMDRTDDGRPIKILTLIDEFTKESLAIYAARRIRANDVIDIFADMMIERGIPEHSRSDNGPKMVAESLRRWLGNFGTKTIYIEPGSPCEIKCRCPNRTRPLSQSTRGCLRFDLSAIAWKAAA